MCDMSQLSQPWGNSTLQFKTGHLLLSRLKHSIHSLVHCMLCTSLSAVGTDYQIATTGRLTSQIRVLANVLRIDPNLVR